MSKSLTDGAVMLLYSHSANLEAKLAFKKSHGLAFETY